MGTKESGTKVIMSKETNLRGVPDRTTETTKVEPSAEKR